MLQNSRTARSERRIGGLGLLLAGGLLVGCTGSSPEPVDRQPAVGKAVTALSAANLDQCANGPLGTPVSCTGSAWQNGNLNENQAHYLEGESIPYRLRLDGLTIAASHAVRIEWDTTELQSGAVHHAEDYLTTVDRTETTADPCSGVTGCAGATVSTWPIPTDPSVAKGPDGLLGTADDIVQVPGDFTLYGGTITSVSAYSLDGAYDGASKTSIVISFTADVPNPVLAWSAHVSLRREWAPELSATHMPGSPYHMRLLDLDGQGGNQDRSLSATAVYALPELIVIKHVINDDGRSAVAADFTMTVTGTDPSPASFPGAEAPGTVVTFAGEGSYSVGESGPSGYGASFSADCTGTALLDEVRTCTVTNDDINLCFGVVCGPPPSECFEAGVCDEATGECVYAPKPEGSLCADDGNVCTADLCDAIGACAHPAGNLGILCRAAAGVCDAAETCDGVSATCPADGFAPSTEVCRASAGACDPPERCTGLGPTCPADTKSVAICRPAVGVCDGPEFCDGVTDECPNDWLQPPTSLCRSAEGVCDVPEFCTGASAQCPGDLKSLAVCRVSADVCDVTEACDGVGNDCPTDAFAPSTSECRASAGICDPPELCTGLGAQCPGDGKSVAECRSAAGACDVPESCDGIGDDCPPNGFAPGTLVCRASGGVCDLPESCTGTDAECPPDLKSTATCRALAGDCDVPESCDALTDSCPPDAFAPSGQLCRQSSGECDPAEVCTGLSAPCPSDVFATCSLWGNKFYDANVNATYDPEELGIAGWELSLTGAGGPVSASTDASGAYAFNQLAEGDYTLCESLPNGSSWLQTAPPEVCFAVHIPYDGEPLDFGNVCVGAGGGKTLGFWSNRNGQVLFLGGDSGASSLALLVDLNLVNADGSAFAPGTYAAVRSWLLAATAVNMANMLSAQLAAMELNAAKGLVDPAALVHAPGAMSANSLGFATLQALMDEANVELGVHPTTTVGDPFRAYQEVLKTALDRANNNTSFVQPTACTFSFAR